MRRILALDIFKSVLLFCLVLLAMWLFWREGLSPITVTEVSLTMQASPMPIVPTLSPTPTATPLPTLLPPTVTPILNPPVLLSPTANDNLTVGSQSFKGIGLAGTELELVVDGVVVGKTKVTAEGTWTLLGELKTAGTHQVQVRMVEATGQTGAVSSPLNLVVKNLPTATLTLVATPCIGRGVDRGTTYVVGPCDTLSHVSFYTGISLESLLAANPTIKDRNLIFSGDIIILPR